MYGEQGGVRRLTQANIFLLIQMIYEPFCLLSTETGSRTPSASSREETEDDDVIVPPPGHEPISSQGSQVKDK